MLIQVTNKCFMGCEHCMEDSRPEGKEMSPETFRKVLGFAQDIGNRIFTISGGEPTEHSDLYGLLSLIPEGFAFTICSNGMWLKDEAKRDMFERITELPGYAGTQVYTNKAWYREYDWVVEHKSEYETFKGVMVDIDAHIWMQDLGRARNSERAQEEVEKNPYYMSCCNTTLMARQISDPVQFSLMLNGAGHFCKPLVDPEGNIHISESRLCPTAGNVTTETSQEIWEKMRKFKPCLSCKGGKRFLESRDPKMIVVRRIILGLN